MLNRCSFSADEKENEIVINEKYKKKTEENNDENYCKRNKLN